MSITDMIKFKIKEVFLIRFSKTAMFRFSLDMSLISYFFDMQVMVILILIGIHKMLVLASKKAQIIKIICPHVLATW